MKRMVRGLALALTSRTGRLAMTSLAFVPGCGHSGHSGTSSDELGACEIAGDGIQDTCYENYVRSDCERDFDTFHAGQTCPAAGYSTACCDPGTETATLFVPPGASCDANENVCGSSSGGNSSCYSDCVDACVRAGGSSCSSDCADVC